MGGTPPAGDRLGARLPRWRRILSSGSSLLETRMSRGVWRVVLEKKFSARSGREPCLSATDLHLVGLGASEVGLPWCRMPVTPL